mgnify:CR=1
MSPSPNPTPEYKKSPSLSELP